MKIDNSNCKKLWKVTLSTKREIYDQPSLSMGLSQIILIFLIDCTCSQTFDPKTVNQQASAHAMKTD
ncbi:hypothetical protein BpHYR1_049894 [Brachionus plicatilis]|uniref:Uncharacterized protein n=1 Tax=Brachionus plicatilis TaxID=10195 RepID=A0A3M7QFP7_BRAPC|nr:hypothetical protein BpHYR1_049894 [Brachionus plicatilis]